MRNFIDAFAVSTRQKLKAFRNNQLGSVTQMFAVAAFPMVIAAGAAIDTVRIGREQVAFNAAVDSAVLAVAADDRASLAGLSTSQQAASIAELELFAKKYLNENYTPQFGDSTEITVDIDITGSAIDLTANHDFPTTIMKITGVEEVNLTAHAQVMKAMRPIEIALVMDTTGSMASGGKIAGAKTAAHTLLNTLYAGSPTAVPQSEYIRVALVPFAGAVRLSKTAYDYSASWIDTTGLNPLSKLSYNVTTGWDNYTTWGKLKSSTTAFMSWNGCVEARNRGTAAAGTDYNVNDAVPTLGTPATLFPAYFAPDTVGTNYGYNYIGTTGTPNEYTGLTSAQQSDTSTAGLLYKQENQNKYLNRVTPTAARATGVAPVTPEIAEYPQHGLDRLVIRHALGGGPRSPPRRSAWSRLAVLRFAAELAVELDKCGAVVIDENLQRNAEVATVSQDALMVTGDPGGAGVR